MWYQENLVKTQALGKRIFWAIEVGTHATLAFSRVAGVDELGSSSFAGVGR
jgi:hypothetical protein